MSPAEPNPARVTRALAAAGRLGRRDFLKCAAGFGALAACGLPAAAVAAAAGTMPEGIRFIGPGEYKVFHRLMLVSLPVEGTALAQLADIPVMQTLDAALLGGMAPHELAGLKDGVALFEDGPRQTYGKPFSALPDKDAAAFCDTWADDADPLRRGLVTALKKLVALSYWANPPTWAALGYAGPVSDRWGLTSIGNAPMPIG